MANLVLCTKCGNWVRGRCAKIKRVATKLAMHFVCSRHREMMKGILNTINKLCDKMETVNGFFSLGNKLNASGGCEAAVIVRIRIMRFRKCRELFFGNRFPLKKKK